MEPTLKQDDLYKLCSVLDNDGNGSITFDEFLYYFEHLEDDNMTDFEKRKADEELYENIWPDWVVKGN